MAEVIQARNLALYEVKEKFNLHSSNDPQFFNEWMNLSPQLSEHEQYWLDKTKNDFLSLIEYPLHEEIIKISVLAPLLSLSNLCRFPFIPAAEKQVELAFEMDEQIVRGRIDLLILHQNLWASTIETKPSQSSIIKALPQVLFYMMAGPDSSQPFFGLVTNGHNFMFIKLLKQEQPIYALSELFTLFRQDNELYQVVTILKHFRDLVLKQAWHAQHAS